MAGQGLERPLQDVSDDLHPDAAFRPAIRNDEPLRPVADGVEHFDMMAKRVRIPFEHRPPEVADIMREREAVDEATGVGVVDRRLFAKEVGKIVQAGVIDVASDTVETAEDVGQDVIEAGREVRAKVSNIVATTNCGMAPMRRDIAEAKLMALGAGAKLARQRLG